MTHSAFGNTWLVVKPEHYNVFERVTLFQKSRNGMLPYKLAGKKIPPDKIDSYRTPSELYVAYEERLIAYGELSDGLYRQMKKALMTRDRASVSQEIVRMVDELFSDPRAGSAILSKGIVKAVVEAQMDDNTLIELFVRVSSVDYTTAVHSVHLMGLLLRYAHYKGIDRKEVERLGRMGLLHDIGKSELPKELWIKPTRLNDEEFRIVKQHPVIGSHILRQTGLIDVVDGAEQHHEKLDGSGYPYKLKADKISSDGQLTAIADFYEALTSHHRVYRQPVSSFDALKQMREEAREGKYDFELFTDFARSFVK